MRNSFVFAWIGVLLSWGTPAFSAHLGLNADAGLMALTNSKVQGGQGPSGSSILTQFNVFYNFPWVGMGAFFQYDWQGSVETAYLLGPKMEFHYGPIFLDAGYAIMMTKNYNDRSIAKDSGSAAYVGLGLRYHLSKSEDDQGYYLQITYRRRTLSTTTRDGIALSEPITQNDSYPLFSMGYSF